MTYQTKAHIAVKSLHLVQNIGIFLLVQMISKVDIRIIPVDLPAQRVKDLKLKQIAYGIIRVK